MYEENFNIFFISVDLEREEMEGERSEREG
jgi:hypothetical protein